MPRWSERLLRRMPRARALAWDLVFLVRSDRSQHGEQGLLLDALPAAGTYLEIGSHQPIKCSNTYTLYRRGWSGWAVDANDYSWLWRAFRPGDVFRVGAVTPNQGLDSITFYDFDHNATLVSTTVKSHAEEWATRGFQYVAREVPAIDVRVLYQEFVEDRGVPTLLAVDVEGLDYSLMEAIERELSSEGRPDFVLVEDLEGSDWTGLLRGCEIIGSAGPSILFRRAG